MLSGSRENPEKIISSLVWFERIDCGERVLSSALYLSLFFGFVFCGVVRNREINPIGIWRCVPGIRTDKLVGEMIEGTHQILNDISCNERQALRRGFDAGDIIDQLSRLRITLGADFIGLRVQETRDFALQISDVLFGPFDLRVT